ncbi:hypothetical protein ABPG74_017076 [Tetrahymena malaccensis]
MFNSSKTFKNMADVEFVSRTQNRLLVVYESDVYDLSQFQNKHPGGATVIKEWKGKSVDNVIFNEAYFRHSRGILSKLNYYKIGTIENATVPDPKAQKQTNQAAPQKNQSQQQQQQSQSKKYNSNMTDQQAQQIAAQKKEQLIKEQNEKQKQAMLEQKKLEEQKKIQIQKQLEQQRLQQQQQQAQQLDKIRAQQNEKRQSVQNNNIQQNMKQQNSSQQQITSEKKVNISPQTKPAYQENHSNNQQFSKQISIVLIDDKGSDHTNNQQNNIPSQKNMNLYPDNPLQSKDSIIQERQTPTNSKQFGKNGRTSISSEKSIGRIKDFLMHAESNAVPSTIPLVNPSQFSQRTIQLEEAKKQEAAKNDPFDDNFDLEDLYNDEQLKQTIIPQSIKFTIFKLLKAIVS